MLKQRVITALVLVVACTNFTNLMFARAEARRREFLIRLALGGGRWRGRLREPVLLLQHAL